MFTKENNEDILHAETYQRKKKYVLKILISNFSPVLYMNYKFQILFLTEYRSVIDCLEIT